MLSKRKYIRLGIYVIFDWVAGFFPEDNWGLSAFDGSHLYEQHDIRNM